MSKRDHTSDNQDLIWDYFQNEQPDSFSGSASRIRFLVSRIQAEKTTLNIGCGSGLLEEFGIRRGLIVYSLDPSEKSIEAIRSRLQLGQRAQVGYIQKIPFPDGFFDAVVVSEVLEHLTPAVMEVGLLEIRRVLKTGGRIIGTVPSREDLKQQSVICPCCGNRFHRWGHEQSFNKNKMEAILKSHFDLGLVIERPFISWSILNWKGKLVSILRSIFWKLGWHGANENVFFDATKIGGNHVSS